MYNRWCRENHQSGECIYWGVICHYGIKAKNHIVLNKCTCLKNAPHVSVTIYTQVLMEYTPKQLKIGGKWLKNISVVYLVYLAVLGVCQLSESFYSAQYGMVSSQSHSVRLLSELTQPSASWKSMAVPPYVILSIGLHIVMVSCYNNNTV